MPSTIRFRRLILFAGVLASLVAVTMPVRSPAADAAIIATNEWPQFGQSAQHLNTNPAEHAFNVHNVAGLSTKFTANFGDSTLGDGGAAVANGMFYIGGFDGDLSAFSTKGCGAALCAPLWRGHTGGGITGTPAVGGGLVVVGSTDHLIYAFPAAGCGRADCPPTWIGKLAAATIDSSVAIANGVAYIGDAAGHLYAFALAGCGRAGCPPLWVGHGESNEVLGAPAVANGQVYVSSFQSTPDLVTGRLLAFSAAGCAAALTCAPSWTAGLDGPASSRAAPTVAGDTVFAGSSTLFGDGTNTDFHLFAFPARGCGAAVCKPLRSYDTGDGGIETAPAVAGNVLYATTQLSIDPSAIGVVAAYPLNGCGAPRCEPLWTGVNFASGFASAPSVVGGVVFVGKGPASGFPVDAGLYAFNAAGCGATSCDPVGFLQLGEEQFYLGAPLAVAGGQVYMASGDNTDGHSKVYVMSVPAP